MMVQPAVDNLKIAIQNTTNESTIKRILSEEIYNTSVANKVWLESDLINWIVEEWFKYYSECGEEYMSTYLWNTVIGRMDQTKVHEINKEVPNWKEEGF